ncbi:MAG TPA: mannose-6-phosphate isomerase, class I [Bacillales bacterium]|nr:mannose-6-phosphate isomerase, class I [Bacillales bacterium]
MKHDPIFLESPFKERIWGGTALRERFGYDIPSEKTGEYWAISAHPNGQSKVREGTFVGKSLGELWSEHRELFGDRDDETFPLLVKIIDANRDLSVQVHPDDAYAREHENGERGKTECWYVIDCEEGSELVYGHHADSREQLKKMIDEGEWDELLQKVEIHPGDFVYVPSGTVHALPAGALILETQQSSDTTYRVYDYDRTDEEGNKRELHLSKAMDCITVPHEDANIEPETETIGDTRMTTFMESEHFTVSKWELNGSSTLEQDEDFLLVSILDGEGTIQANGQDFPFKKGDHFILPSGLGKFDVEGKATGITSHP